MNSQLWDTVLVEWVNCLNISEPVQSIKDLRNGEFFNSLTKLLYKNASESLDTLPAIIKLLKEQYPKYKFKKEHNVYLEDLSDNCLIAITSLLMYYSCCLDRREVLTSPMCYRLSQTTQLCIRTFLEKLHKDITESELSTVIEQSISNNDTVRAQMVSHWFSAGDSPISNKSPLQDFLKTPSSKIARIQEKERELKNLNSQLELERYEKSDLQDELKQQITKNKTLDAQLKQKIAELARLRGEIIALENRTPPHYQDVNSREVQRRLRGEIENLEHYVAQLETDNESLQKENDSAKEKVKKLESQYLSWQERVQVAENNYDRLMEKSQQQEEELQSLKIHCTQLSAMLEEFRCEKSPNESAVEVYETQINVSNKEYTSTEDLACSVVEVQLRDVQKENLQLKGVINELEEKSQLLNDKLVKANEKFGELELSFGQLQDDNLNLLAKVSILSDTQNMLELSEKNLSKSNRKIDELEARNGQLFSELTVLRGNFEKTESLLQETLRSNDSLTKQLQELRLVNENYELSLNEKNEMYDLLEKEAKSVAEEHKKVVQKYNATSFELAGKTKLLDDFNRDVEHHLINLERLIFDHNNNNFDYTNKNAVFEIFLKQIESEVNDKKGLFDKVIASENLIAKLHEDISMLNERHSIDLEEKQKLREQLELANTNVDVLQGTVASYELKIVELKGVIEELDLNVKELEKLKHVVDEKENANLALREENDGLKSELVVSNKEIVENNESIRKLKDVVFTLKSSQTDLEAKLDETTIELDNRKGNEIKLVESLTKLQAEQNALENQLDCVKEELLEKTKEKEEMEKIVKILEGSLKSMGDEIKNKDAAFVDLNQQKNLLDEQLNVANGLITNLRESECNLKETMFSNEKATLETIADLNLQNEQYCKRIKQLEEELQGMVKNCKEVEMEMERLRGEKDEAEVKWKTNKENLNKNVSLLKSTIGKLQDDMKRKADENEALVNKHLLEAHENYVRLNEEKDELTRERDQLKCDLNELIDKAESAEELCREKDNVISERNKELLVLKLEVENKNDLIEARESEIDDLNSQINTLKGVIDQLKTHNDEYENEINETRKEIKIMTKLKCDLQKGYQQLEKTTGDILKNVSSKNDELNNLVLKLSGNKKCMQSEIENLQLSLSENSKKIQTLSDENSLLENRHEVEILQLNETISRLTDSIELINAREINYIQEIRLLKEELSDNIAKYMEALQVQEEIKQENEAQINNLTENLHGVVSKYNQLDKVHQETLIALDQQNEQYEMAQNEKICLETKLLELKTNYEASHELMKDELLEQIENLTSTSDSLRKQLEKTSAELEGSIANGIEMRGSVEFLNEALRKVELEKNNLLKEVDLLNENCKKMQNEYDTLQIEHEKYIKSSQSALADAKNELNQKINVLIKEKVSLQEKLNNLADKLEKTESEVSDLVELKENIVSEKDAKIQKLEASIEEYESKVSILTVDQDELQKRILLEKLKQDDLKRSLEASETERREQENTITKLKCANDILETGKINLENACSKLRGNAEALRGGIDFAFNKLKAIKEEKEKEIAVLNKERSFFLEELEIKNKSLSEAEHNLAVLNKALEHLKLQNDDLSKENIHLNGRLEQQEMLIKSQQQDYKEKNEALNKLEMNKNELKRKLTLVEENRLELVNEIRMKQDKILDLSERNDRLESEIQTTMMQMSEVNMKMGQHLETISKLTAEKQKLENALSVLNVDLLKVKKNRDDIRDAQTKMIKETENNILRAHEDAIEVKNDLLKRVELAERDKENQIELRNETERALDEERKIRQSLELRILELTNEKSTLQQLSILLQNGVQKLNCVLQEKPVEISYSELDLNSLSNLETTIFDVESRVIDILEKKRALSETISRLEKENLETIINMKQLQNEKDILDVEKEKLMKDYDALIEEKAALGEQNEKQHKSFEELQMEHDMLQARYEQIAEYSSRNETLHTTNCKLENEISSLKLKNENISANYNKFSAFMKEYKSKIDKIISLRNSLDGLYNTIRLNLRDVQQNFKNDTSSKLMIERKESLEIIAEDIQKRMNRTTKFIYELLQNALKIYNQSVECILNDKPTNYEKKFEDLNANEEIDKLDDLKDTAVDLCEKLKALNVDINNFNIKQEKKPLKENMALNRTNVQDEDLKKKNLQLKQRLTLAESAKSNLERKIKQLREDYKKLPNLDNDEHYKTLLRQHIDTKDELERILKESDERYKRLLQEFEEYKLQNQPICNKDSSKDTKIYEELKKMRDAYTKVMSDNNRFELENDSLRKLLEDRSAEMNELYNIKEAYERLLEENNKLSMELDTVKYKRGRDREEFVRLLNKEKGELAGKETNRIQEIRNEYEIKLERMKEKMIKMYKEEVDKEMKKVLSEKNENVYLLRVIDQLKCNLKDAKMRVHETELERDRALDKLKSQGMMRSNAEAFGSHESLFSIKSQAAKYNNDTDSVRGSISSFSLPRGVRPSYSKSRNPTDERKAFTLPRGPEMNVIEEITISRRTSMNSLAGGGIGPNIEMEDEEDAFNNKYLTDLKEGRCLVANEQDSTARYSELTWRNSLCPPHLKSSYPAEMQFISPNRFKEDEIKFGNTDFDSSSTKLLPVEKPRMKKDIGTTSYKRPGPPTPSKNGGRVSLQGNEFHLKQDSTKDNDSKTPKRFTPNRLKGLFMGRNSSVRDNSENHPTTPKSKRLSIFRKPR